jgi:hypothetical protein
MGNFCMSLISTFERLRISATCPLLDNLRVRRFRSELSRFTESLYDLARPLPVRAKPAGSLADPQDILNPKVSQVS